MKKTLIALSLFTAFAVNAQTVVAPSSPASSAHPSGAHTNTGVNTGVTTMPVAPANAVKPMDAAPMNSPMPTPTTKSDMKSDMKSDVKTNAMNSKDIPDTTSLNKKVVKEGEKTQEALQKGKISADHASKLDQNESAIARDISAAKMDGKVSGNEKSIIKSEIKINSELRDEMKDKHKDAKKN